MRQTIACRRCGTCCIKGGPALHREDMHLVEHGTIPLADLFTLRQGELALDNVAGRVAPAPGEIVKIKGRRHSREWTCRYYQGGGTAGTAACSIYAERPAECRALSCHAPEQLTGMYHRDRLSRRDIIPRDHALRQLMDAHEERCSHTALAEEAGQLAAGPARAVKAADAILAMLRYDADLRRLLADRGIDPEMLDFAFGRPLTDSLHAYGLTAEPNGETFTLAPAKR